jgi:XisI protein
MEKVRTYQQILLSFLEDYSKITYANAPNLEQQVLVDTKRNHFQLVSVGWQKGKFIYDVVFHFDIKNGQIWIQQNWTELKLRQELVERGVANQDIFVGFSPLQQPAEIAGQGISGK